MNQLAQDLRAAKALIDTPEKWTKRVFARDSSGFGTPYDGGQAVCFCSAGAIFRTVGDDPTRERAAMNALAIAMGGDRPSIAAFNDTSEHAEVMAAFDKAIAAAEAQS